jgi:hypothetical protein
MKTNTQNTKSGLKSRAEQLNTAKSGLVRISFARRRTNRSLDTETLLIVLRSKAPRFFELAEVVGKWVWIQFAAKQPQEITSQLSQLGFHWNNARQTWQHPCGMYRDEALPFDPRKKYGSYFPADIRTA